MIYTCTECKNDVHYVFEGKVCYTCYRRVAGYLTVGEFAEQMKADNPDNPKAWND